MGRQRLPSSVLALDDVYGSGPDEQGTVHIEASNVSVFVDEGGGFDVATGDGGGSSTFHVAEDAAPPASGVTVRRGISKPTLEVDAAFNHQSNVPILVVSSDLTPLFRIDADGTVHIKTGTTIHADL